jgi:hypothetical protein
MNRTMFDVGFRSRSPWDPNLGASLRDIYRDIKQVIFPAVKPAVTPPPAPPPKPGGFLGIPTTYLLIGGGIAIVGGIVIAVLASGD